MTYYDDLTKDEKRVSGFEEAIINKAYGIVYDLGTGSGILAIIASKYADKVYAFEINPLIIKRYSKELSSYNNIEVVEADLTEYKYEEQKPDVIICEMLDTALIDEEQVPVINNVLSYIKENTVIIPEATVDTIQVGCSNISHITYLESGKPEFDSYSSEYEYNKTRFSRKINPNFKGDIVFEIENDGLVNTLLITTYTYVTGEIVLRPTPMLNPPLLIPIKEIEVRKNEKIMINLEYKMGGGLNTIRANIERVI
jgi:predicted RNA methylase